MRKALSAVARVHGKFGLTLAAKLLAGEDDPRLSSSGLRNVSTFGVLRGKHQTWLVSLLAALRDGGLGRILGRRSARCCI